MGTGSPRVACLRPASVELPDGSRQEIFGSGGGRAVAESLTRAVGAEVPLLGQNPLDTNLRECAELDAGGGVSARELDVLNGMAQGASNQRIASERSISVRTVTTHVERILVKLGQESRVGAAAKATREGFLRLDLMATLPASPGPRHFGSQA